MRHLKLLLVLPILAYSATVSANDYIANVRGEGAGAGGGGLFWLWWVVPLLVALAWVRIEEYRKGRSPTLQDKMDEYKRVAAQRVAEEEQEARAGALPAQSQSASRISGGRMESLTPWRKYAVTVHVIALVLLGTILQVVDGSDAAQRLLPLWLAGGAGFAVVPIFLGCLGTLYKRDRTTGFVVGSWAGAILLVLGTLR